MSRSVRALSTLALVVVLVASACSGGEPTPRPSSSSSASTPGTSGRSCGDDQAGDDTSELSIGDRTWSFQVHRPPGHDGERLPVVYQLHGLGSTGAQNLLYTGFAAAADEHGFIVVSPDARGEARSWDVQTPRFTRGSDLDFLYRLMQRVPREWCGDPDRQDVAGLSNGSAMAFAMACDGGFPARAYGAVAAAFYVDYRCDDAPPESIVYFHGTSDMVVPYGGGPTPLFPVEAATASLDKWGRHDACGSSDERAIGSDVTLETWRGCDDGARLQFYTIADGGHTWPGAAADIPPLGRTTRTVDATDVMVSFFGLD